MSKKLRKNCNFEASGATLSHEMDVGRQKLRKNCNFYWSRATLSHEMDVGRQLDDGWPESEKDVFQAALRMVVVKDSR